MAKDAPRDDLDGLVLAPFCPGDKIAVDNVRNKTLHGKSGEVERVHDEDRLVVKFKEADITKSGSVKKLVSRKIKKKYCRLVEEGPVRKTCAWTTRLANPLLQARAPTMAP